MKNWSISWIALGTLLSFAQATWSHAQTPEPANALTSNTKTPITAEQRAFFETHIRPVLIKECYSCHSTKSGNAKGGLRLDTQALTHLGGSSGPAVVPNDLEGSLLLNAMRYQDFAMPPDGPLAKSVVDRFQEWIEMGAPDPRQDEPQSLHSTITKADIDRAREEHWAYRKPQKPAIPGDARSNTTATNASNASPSPTAWAKTDIDRFIIDQLSKQSLTPASDATPAQVIRRLSFDLTGLPPTPDQQRLFEIAWQSNPQSAVEQATEQYLESPQFGEHWGRHWLDVVRYAESNGREVNMTFPHAWRYRDYVIDSFNQDKPFDRFVQEQLAGDLLPAKTDEQWASQLIATTFLAIGPKSLSEQNRVQFAADLVDEQIDVTTRVFLGTSVACARCHDHKFDPIPQDDYYAMAGIFASTRTYYGVPASSFGTLTGIQNRNTSSLIVMPVQDRNPFDRAYRKEEMEAMTNEIRELRQQLVEARRAQRQGQRPGANNNSMNQSVAVQNPARLLARIEALSAMLGSVDENGEPITFCMGVQDDSSPRDSRVLIRGEIDKPAHVARRDFPQVLRDSPATIKPASSGRRELASWIGSDQNPLTARVMVNRVWQYLMGQGLVRTTEDFGSTGEAPTHPELLDHLAIRFVESGWSVKSLIREITSSRIYRADSTFDEAKFNADPENRYLWRANPKRLTAEAIRDTMLWVGGNLDLERPRASEVAKAGYMQVRDGNLININQLLAPGAGMMASMEAMENPRQAFANQLMRRSPAEFGRTVRNVRSGIDRVDMIDATYRSVYLPIIRDQLPRSLEVFDFAEPSMVIGTRETSSTANQALYLMNNEFVIRQSEAMAKRVQASAETTGQQISLAFQLAYGRKPTSTERSASEVFLRTFLDGSRYRDQSTLSLAALCQSLLASAEFRYLD